RQIPVHGFVALARVAAVASTSVCAPVAGVVLAQYIFTLKGKMGRKKTIEMFGKNTLTYVCVVHAGISIFYSFLFHFIV
uniref:Uncharacterized protein n=1 Tax=Catagonus wagneri TaxID=51154 RepID=A0A8C3W0D1_9CETA